MKPFRPTLLLPLALLLTDCLQLVEHEELWPCESNADCTKDKRCRHVAGTGKVCTKAEFCAVTEDCDTGWLCDNTRCIPQQCTEQDASACNGFGCDGRGLCQSWCETAHACAVGYGCQDGRCVPANCDSFAPDPCGGLLCREGVCLTSCASPDDCTVGLTCVRGACEQVPGAWVYCTQPCSVGECVGGLCVTYGSLCEGMLCGEDQGLSCGQCGPGHVCTDTFVCADACGSKECGTYFGVDCGSCSGQLVCNPSGTCVSP
jgi:hypothetical protein